ADDLAQWAVIGQLVWKLEPRRVLDAASRALVERLHSAAAPATAAELATLLDRLDQSIVADTALNQLQLRPQIHRALATRGPQPFAALNDWIYAEVFHTPRTDAWLGLLPRTDFTGLPGDGVVTP
nr:hypothetical protein [Myxococcota bacterium]